MQTLERKIAETQNRIDNKTIKKISTEEIKKMERSIMYLGKYLNSRCGT